MRALGCVVVLLCVLVAFAAIAIKMERWPRVGAANDIDARLARLDLELKARENAVERIRAARTAPKPEVQLDEKTVEPPAGITVDDIRTTPTSLGGIASLTTSMRLKNSLAENVSFPILYEYCTDDGYAVARHVERAYLKANSEEQHVMTMLVGPLPGISRVEVRLMERAQ